MLLAVLRDLFPFLAALYVLDAIAWVRAGHLLLVCQSGWCSVREPGVWLAGLLPVDVAFAVSRPGPLLAPTGVYLPDPQAQGVAVYDPDRWTLIPYEQIDRLEVEEGRLRLGISGEIRLPSRSHAESLAARLQEIREAPPGQRPARVSRLLTAAFDLDAIRERRATFRRTALQVQIPATALFLVLFAGLPAVLYLGAPPELLSPALGLALLLFFWSVVALYRAGRDLQWKGALRRLPSLSSVLFTPPAAPRAVAHLGRDLFHDFDATAVAAVLLSKADLLGWLRGELHASAWTAARGDAAWQAAWGTRRDLLRKALEKLGVTESEAFTPPARRDPEAAAWCPFCDTEYRAGFSTCRDCSLPLHFL